MSWNEFIPAFFDGKKLQASAKCFARARKSTLCLRPCSAYGTPPVHARPRPARVPPARARSCDYVPHASRYSRRVHCGGWRAWWGGGGGLGRETRFTMQFYMWNKYVYTSWMDIFATLIYIRLWNSGSWGGWADRANFAWRGDQNEQALETLFAGAKGFHVISFEWCFKLLRRIGNFVCTPADSVLSRYREIWYVGMKIVWNILRVYGSVFRRKKVLETWHKARCTSAKLLILIVLRQGTAAVRLNCCNRVYVMGRCFLLFLQSETENSDTLRNNESSLNFSWMKCKYPHMNAIVHFAGRIHRHEFWIFNQKSWILNKIFLNWWF